jgi:hypothetical protein
MYLTKTFLLNDFFKKTKKLLFKNGFKAVIFLFGDKCSTHTFSKSSFKQCLCIIFTPSRHSSIFVTHVCEAPHLLFILIESYGFAFLDQITFQCRKRQYTFFDGL